MVLARSAGLLLGAALVLGGWRDPRLFALGGAAVWAAVWSKRPPIGRAAAWLPWIAWSCLSALRGPQPLAALPGIARWSTALAFASLAAEWDERERLGWIQTLIGAAGLLALAAFWTGAPLGFRAAMTGLIPPYYNYTAFALAACSAGATAWALHPGAVRPAWRLAGLVAAAAGGFCILLAHSRGAALGLFAAAAFWAVRRWGGRAGAVVFVISLASIVAFRENRLPDSWRAAVVKRGAYQEARPAIWARAATMADEKPWFGVGPGNFGAGFRMRPVEVLGGRARWGMGTGYAHSEALQAAAETGWGGLALWLIGLGAFLAALLGRASDDPTREAAATAVVAMLVQLTFDNMLQIPGLAMLFFSAAAVAGGGAAGWRWSGRTAVAGGVLVLLAWIPGAAADGHPNRAAALFPAESGPREDLGNEAFAAGRLGEADEFFAEAERRSPFNAVYPWRRSQIAAAQGRWGEAESQAMRAENLEPGFMSDRVLRAAALLRLGRRRDARAELTEVLRILRARGDRPASSGYDQTVWTFDRAEFERVAASAGK